VKPGNVLLAQSSGRAIPDHAYLTDFGLTKMAKSNTALTKTGQFLGTVNYVAPEQIQGKEATAQADIYPSAAWHSSA
jgi:serine/threonine-protein kinase